VKSKKILLTGVSSFTGYWFAKTLSECGYQVHCPLPSCEDSYDGIKKNRLESLSNLVRLVYSCSFGSHQFFDLLENKYDILCHHASFVKNYQSKNFELTEAISQNTSSAERVLEKLASTGCGGIIWSSSVFEDFIHENEIATNPRPNWYRYALSKKLSGFILENLSLDFGLNFSKFVITNPFGPLEDRKFNRLILEAAKSKVDFEVRTPNYIRDMIHVRHLALAYKCIVDRIIENQICYEMRPYEYTGNLYYLADYFMQQIKLKINTPSTVIHNNTIHSEEPLVLINDQHISKIIEAYDPVACWEEYLNLES
jgi:UDP-glucose 4-epimerase